VSLEASSLCVVDANGKIVREGKVASGEPHPKTTIFGEVEHRELGR
jgi:hypothetical protein